MGTRISLGKGFTFGASGLRWGHRIPGVPRGYASVGASGTLVTGGPLRHWEPAARRTPRGTARCQGTTLSGDQCRNGATLGTTCRLHADQAVEAGEGWATSAPASGERRDNQWGAGAYALLITMVAIVIGLSMFISGAEGSYCAKNTGYARDSIPVCSTYPAHP